MLEVYEFSKNILFFSLFLRMKNKAMEEQQPKMKTSEHNSLEINAEHGLLFREFSCPVTHIHNSYAIFSSSYRLSNVLINFKIKNWHSFNYLITEKLLFSSKFAFINFSRNSLRYQTLKKNYIWNHLQGMDKTGLFAIKIMTN